MSVEDWKNLSPSTQQVVDEITELVSCETVDPLLKALGTLSPPPMLLKDLIDEMELRADKDSQSDYIDR